MNKMKMWKDPNFYSNIILSVLFISLFIGIFFFTYASMIERRIVVRQTEDLVNNLTEGAGILLSDRPMVRDFIQNLSAGDMSGEDQRMREKNDQLLNKAGIFMSVFAVVLLGVSILLIVYFKLDYKKLLLTNTIGLIVVALVEFSFLTFIAQNYISFDPNYVKHVMVSELDKFSKQNIPLNNNDKM